MFSLRFYLQKHILERVERLSQDTDQKRSWSGSIGLPNMASLHPMHSAVSRLADSVSVTSLIGK